MPAKSDARSLLRVPDRVPTPERGTDHQPARPVVGAKKNRPDGPAPPVHSRFHGMASTSSVTQRGRVTAQTSAPGPVARSG